MNHEYKQIVLAVALSCFTACATKTYRLEPVSGSQISDSSGVGEATLRSEKASSVSVRPVQPSLRARERLQFAVVMENHGDENVTLGQENFTVAMDASSVAVHSREDIVRQQEAEAAALAMMGAFSSLNATINATMAQSYALNATTPGVSLGYSLNQLNAGMPLAMAADNAARSANQLNALAASAAAGIGQGVGNVFSVVPQIVAPESGIGGIVVSDGIPKEGASEVVLKVELPGEEHKFVYQVVEDE